MPDYEYIYNHQADLYERLVGHEDYEGNLMRALEGVVDFRGLDVVETGAGTGRVTGMLARLAGSMRVFDRSAHMLARARGRLARSGLAQWRAAVADHRYLPVESGSADVVISGWSVCYLAVNSGEAWQVEVEKGLNEFRRVLRPGGKVILIETLGTGYETPTRPASLADYLGYLEAHGFQSAVVRTDLRFESLEEERELVSFFFGEAMVERVKVEEAGVILPECTGVWWDQRIGNE
ncbi:MAG: class I SAM-dependent methyltransferase [Chloroflexota bacterium]